MNDSTESGKFLDSFVKVVLIMSGTLKSFFATPTPGLDRLARQAEAADSLTRLVRNQLPEPLRSHVVSASRREADLVVIVDSAAWSARVRYAGRALKQQLAEAGVDPVAKLRVRVRAPR
jgi:hypothetical protein